MANKLYLNIKKRLSPLFSYVSNIYKNHQGKVLGGLGILLVVLIFASLFTRNGHEEVVTPEVKSIASSIFAVGSQDLTHQSIATVEDLGTVTLVSQTAGPINQILKTEGEYVYAGTWITQQTTGYATGNSATISRQIAEKNYILAEETLRNTVTTVSANRELADKNRDNTEELRQISDESIGHTQKLLDQTALVIEKIEADIAATADADTIQSLRQQLVSYQGSFNQTETALKQLRYSTDKDEEPTKIADINKNLVYASTEIQLKSAVIQKEIAALSLKSAQIAEALTCVKAPFAGTIERILVKEGQYVTPGTPVAVISGASQLQLVTNVSGPIATRIDTNAALTITYQGEPIEATITHASTNPTVGQLYQVIATVPAVLENDVFTGQTLDITLPLLTKESIETEATFIPLNAVFVTNTGSFVYVLEEDKAVTRVVETGTIIGSQIEIKSGLIDEDQIILNRQVIENQPVEVEG